MNGWKLLANKAIYAENEQKNNKQITEKDINKEEYGRIEIVKKVKGIYIYIYNDLYIYILVNS